MTRLSATEIVSGDIVILEAFITRWKPQESYMRRTWEQWTTAFRLESITLMCSKGEEPQHLLSHEDDGDDDLWI